VTVTGDPARDLAQLVAMVDGLEEYLEQGHPYRPVVADWPGGGRQTVTLSIGTIRELLAALERDAERLAPAERAALETARETLRAVQSQRRLAYIAMLQHELRSQLDSWRWFVEDWSREEDPAAGRYAREVATRLRVEGLMDEADAVGADIREARGRAAASDDALAAHFEPGDYCGPHDQAPRYARERYWWLYGHPTPAGRR
jgi:hypothetical protein